MENCECRYQDKIPVLINNNERWEKIIDGNGKGPIQVRLNDLEQKTEQHQKTMEETVQSQELLRRTVSSLTQAEKYRKEMKSKTFGRWVQTITIILMAIALTYEMFFK